MRSFTLRRFIAILLLALAAGCSSPQPPQTFLNASIRIRTFSERNSVFEMLRMKPKDIYAAFDTNIIEKKWKRVDDASWSFVFKGDDPSLDKNNTIIITFTSEPSLNNDVVVTKVRVNDRDYSPGMIVEMMRQLDDAFAPRK